MDTNYMNRNRDKRMLRCFCDASWFDLVLSFWDDSNQNKMQKEGKKLLFLKCINFALYLSELNLSYHCTNETKISLKE